MEEPIHRSFVISLHTIRRAEALREGKTSDPEFGIKQLRRCSSYLIENINELSRPARLKVGKSMTIAVADYIVTDSADMINVDSTVRVITSLKEKIRNLWLSPSASLLKLWRLGTSGELDSFNI